MAEHVCQSQPAVSAPLTQLRAPGVIRPFTVMVDRQPFAGGIPVQVELDVLPTELEQLYRTVKAIDGTEHVFKTHEETIVAHGTAPGKRVSAWL